MENTNIESIDQLVKNIEKECLHGKISPLAATEKIDKAIGGITAVCYKEDLKFKVDNHNKRLGLNCIGLPRGQIEALHELAVCIYMKAQQNGSSFPGEVHIEHGLSTKHYKPGIIALYQKILSHYSGPAYAGGTA